MRERERERERERQRKRPVVSSIVASSRLFQNIIKISDHSHS